jgi:CheY-like chemotaxis protein
LASAEQAPPPVAAAAPDLPVPTRPLRILLAEDSQVNQKYAATLLERRGHRVTVAADGREALELAGREEFDVVLMDVQMPELDGFAATGEIRRRERETGRRQVPIVAMTAHAMQGDRERCLAAGMDAYVSKPLRPEQFLPVVERTADRLEASALVAPAAAAPLAEDLVDWAQARARVAGDEELLAELIGVFFEEFPRSRRQLAAALESGDAVAVGRLAHTLKSSFGHFGAAQAAAAAQRLETAGQTGTLAGAADLLGEFDVAAAEVLPVLESFVTQRRAELEP